MTRLDQLTTLRIGGPVGSLVDAASEQELVDAVRGADAAGTPVLVLGGGSNVVVSDDGFDGLVVRDTRQEVSLVNDGACGGLTITATSGFRWDSLVAHAVEHEWSGFEALSGIPGSTGATPIQNVGAYGAQVSDIVSSVRTWDRAENRIRTFAWAHCDFGYRDSVFKRSIGAVGGSTPRYVVLSVEFHTRMASLSAPIRYAQLASALGVHEGARVPIVDVREAVLALRASKGMVLDEADHDTWSVGSFFTNPVVPVDEVPAGAPAYPAAADGMAKTSAAWLIEHAGFAKGFALEGSRAALSSKHTLALTNRGGATADEIVALARRIRDGVRDAYGITLVPEPVAVGIEI